eukprot:6178994-Pleurochrysis_carterae.AAC.4
MRLRVAVAGVKQIGNIIHKRGIHVEGAGLCEWVHAGRCSLADNCEKKAQDPRAAHAPTVLAVLRWQLRRTRLLDANAAAASANVHSMHRRKLHARADSAAAVTINGECIINTKSHEKHRQIAWLILSLNSRNPSRSCCNFILARGSYYHTIPYSPAERRDLDPGTTPEEEGETLNLTAKMLSVCRNFSYGKSSWRCFQAIQRHTIDRVRRERAAKLAAALASLAAWPHAKTHHQQIARPRQHTTGANMKASSPREPPAPLARRRAAPSPKTCSTDRPHQHFFILLCLGLSSFLMPCTSIFRFAVAFIIQQASRPQSQLMAIICFHSKLWLAPSFVCESSRSVLAGSSTRCGDRWRWADCLLTLAEPCQRLCLWHGPACHPALVGHHACTAHAWRRCDGVGGPGLPIDRRSCGHR